MALTKKKKLSILKKMLALVSSKSWDYQFHGLCTSYRRATKSNFLSDKGTAAAIIDLGILLPDSADPWWFWWDMTKSGLASRKRALRTAIKKLS